MNGFFNSVVYRAFMTYSTLLFDLDGTLTDPFVGITRSIQHALERMGAAHIPEAEDLRWCIGPPLWESFGVLLDSDDRAVQDRAVAFYRERYTTEGLFENTIIEGVERLVADLEASGRRMFVATSKPHTYAARIIEHFGLLPHFGKVYGSELDGTRSAKADLIAFILEQESIASTDCIMVGDRKHDLIGAKANKVAALGVTWGYGSREELEAEHPAAIFDRPQDLGSWVLTG
ncbi:HAD hydrolase-like protein [uncultured Roseibium sp.]|uniref:HAD hydrolase-like protein n=1 Tax=uncultured Roseibium sp. TaxID=1936171 RepID=UPI0032163A0A